ncbi:hypothetical protein HPB51_017677 [Rhipicephalus microplus]|uniref:Tick transposon n=1 Tax=Rhipicephalus microplus TaxID=6941 RepID=A0A9J6E239_RHIMP|nr:hypothetical protein HPB51_017677 [Rhipicephalus microplus]
MFSAIPPPTFLQCPGVPPIPWKTWRHVVQVYVDAVAPDVTPDTKKALLLNALRVEELQAYYKAADEQVLLDGVQASGNGATCDTYQQALAVLDAYFAPPEDPFCVRARFRRRVQELDETSVRFVLVLRWLANNYNFGTAVVTMVKNQILHGLRDPDLLRSFVQMGHAFTVQPALKHVKTCVDRTFQQLAALQADSITGREHRRRRIRFPRPIMLQRYTTNPAVRSAPPRSAEISQILPGHTSTSYARTIPARTESMLACTAPVSIPAGRLLRRLLLQCCRQLSVPWFHVIRLGVLLRGWLFGSGLPLLIILFLHRLSILRLCLLSFCMLLLLLRLYFRLVIIFGRLFLFSIHQRCIHQAFEW